MDTLPAETTDYPWLRHYAPGVDWHAPLPPGTLVQMLQDSVAQHAARPCMDFFGRRWSYAELGAEVNRAAAGLRALGVQPGMRVGLCLPNTPYYVVAFYAALSLGAVVVNYNPLYVAEELATQAEDSGTSVMVTTDLQPMLSRVLGLLGKGPVQHVVVCSFAAALPVPKNWLFRLVRRQDIGRLPADPRVVPWARLMAAAPIAASAAVQPGDLAVLQYTGGTTGRPKGAMLTHRNLHANMRQAQLCMPNRPAEGGVVMAVLPFFHVYALTSVLNGAIGWGAMLAILPKFEAPMLLQTLRRTRATVLHAVPTIYKALIDAGATREDFATLRICNAGGAPLPLEVKRQFEQVAGCVVVEGYGLTEASPVSFCNPLEGENRAGTIGLPVPGVRAEIRALDDPQRVLPIGERGELCIVGPNIMAGYWQRPEETAQAIGADGFLHTGDVGIMDAEGYVTLVDRIKDLILCSGYNVYPRQIEEALYRHPDVVAATALGMPDDYRGESPAAFVQLRNGATVDEAGLRHFLKDHLSPIEMPRLIEIRAELPRTAVGKLSKKELKAELQSRVRA